MEEKQFEKDKTNKKLEQIVLVIFTVFSLAMSVSAFLLKWGILAKELIIVSVIAGWIVSWKEYRDFAFRAKFISLMCWINFFIYVIYSNSFTSMLSSMMALIVLLSIFCITDIIYIGVFFTTLICLYHIVFLHSVQIHTPNDILRLVLHIISAYVISLVVWITIRIREETSEKLMENIRELEIVEKSKDDFMVNISHEIRTPINAVCGMSEALLQEELPTDVRRDIIDIQTAGRNLLATVSNILDFSELESGKMELMEESYNITSTITDIINMALTFENGRQLEFIVDCDANLPSNLVGDEQKLRRIVMNLLENAMKFTKEGGIVLRIKFRKEEYGINLMVSIRDSGIGMSQAEIERVFTSYGQLDSKRSREEGGVGLGLSIAQALVQRMGGFITVESEPGVGTEFLFTIPQKVLDETPIVSIKNKGNLFAACYINMDKYNFSVIREGYEKSIRHMAEQFGILFRICRNLPELKRRIEHENYSHVFISFEEYCEDKAFFENLAKELTVVLILDYGQEKQVGSEMLRIYKPFTVLSIAAVFNGQKTLQREDVQKELKHRFIAPEAKMLVVDDNAMNLKVMARLLLPYQIRVDMASSGQEALHKLDTMEYDCVFLDHMMPEMDGVETTRVIRRLLGDNGQVPIIALTANAVEGTAEMFISEGMNDFVTKPIEMRDMVSKLRRWLPPEKIEKKKKKNKNGASLRNAAKDDSGAQATTDIVIEGLDVQKAMGFLGNEELFWSVLKEYYRVIEKKCALIQEYEQKEQWKNYTVEVHALKSASRQIGAMDLAYTAEQMEAAGNAENAALIHKITPGMLEEYMFYKGILAPYFTKEEEAGSGRAAEKEEISELFRHMEDAMENLDMDAMEQVISDMSQYSYDDVQRSIFERLENAVEDIDTERCEEIIAEWKRELDG